ASRFSYNLWKRDGVGVPDAANDQPIVTWHVAWLFVGYEFADIAEFAAFARHVHVVVKTPDLAIVKVLEIETFATTQDRRILHPQRTISPCLEKLLRGPRFGGSCWHRTVVRS